MLIEARLHNHNKTFILYNVKDITKGEFPISYAKEFISICNGVLALNKKINICSEEELLKAMA